MFFLKFVQFVSSKSKFAKKNPAPMEDSAGEEKPRHGAGAERFHLTPEYFNAITCTRIAQKCILAGAISDIDIGHVSPLAEAGFKNYAESGCSVVFTKGFGRFSAAFGVSREENGLTYRLRGVIKDESGIHRNVVVRNGLTYDEVERAIVIALLADHRDEGEIGAASN